MLERVSICCEDRIGTEGDNAEILDLSCVDKLHKLSGFEVTQSKAGAIQKQLYCRAREALPIVRRVLYTLENVTWDVVS